MPDTPEIECPACNGCGEVQTTIPSASRARMVGHDDLDPSDFTAPCGECDGTGWRPMTDEERDDALRELTSYNPDTGHLTWRKRERRWFRATRDCHAWNARYSGTRAFDTDDKRGYRQGSFLGKQFKAHRVAWFLHHGSWPENEIDHVNGNKSDNRITNLRDAARTENCKNLPLGKSNKSGVIGVSWSQARKKWAASIKVNRRDIFLGRYDDLKDAQEARRKAEIAYGFSSFHGRPSSEPPITMDERHAMAWREKQGLR